MQLTTQISTMKHKIPAGKKIFLQHRAADGALQIFEAKTNCLLVIVIDPEVFCEAHGPQGRTELHVSGWVIVDDNGNYRHKVFTFA